VSVVSGSTTLDELHAMCSPAALESLNDVALARFAELLLGWWPRLDAGRLAVIAAVEARQAYKVDGARDAASWIAWKAGERRGVARREVETAMAVAQMPAVADGLAAGALSKAKAAELARAVDASPDDQAALVETAKTASVDQVARHVDRWQTEHRPHLDAETVSFVGRRLEATLSTESMEWVRTAVDAAAAQLDVNDLPWPSRQAKGLTAVCRYFVEHADNPRTRGTRPTVVVSLDIDTLAARSGGSARLDSGRYISGDDARRLACDAGVVRLITAGAAMPLDLGAKTRTVSPAQARAVIHRDRHCRYDGCTAPAWAGEVHHLDFWTRDNGPTNLTNLALICWHHHTLVHRSSTTHDLTDRGDGRLRLQRRTDHPDAA
jgi:hypothetical protein